MNNPSIRSISFLMPCNLELVDNDGEFSIRGALDYANRRFYCETRNDVTPEFEAMVFEHLATITHPPEDTYKAEDSVYENADRATDKFNEAREQHLGGTDE